MLIKSPRRNALAGMNGAYNAQPTQNALAQPDYGMRQDGTRKGRGFFGELKRPDGDISTEISVGVNIGGKEMEIPTLVPTLSPQEINYLLSGKPPTREIVDKAVMHARERMKAGLPVFAE